MKTIICNSLQSFWDMGDNQFLEGHNVHCVFPINSQLREFILGSQERYRIKSISFSHAFA
ncbi:hypothetical protein [Vibrio aestuarianus]|uniref:hypothetical protein n=1 Tax=Vibrio aestuarianus TaxID=28171 RepID=UPI00237CF914|nr:hypothetical protein [Vibrio aestuarianus]MDE1327908.1 hypothetical protein [Vibrio aestuarianus]MDE1331013.1 hypothetical protein [Vibrio aestuarianus]